MVFLLKWVVSGNGFKGFMRNALSVTDCVQSYFIILRQGKFHCNTTVGCPMKESKKKFRITLPQYLCFQLPVLFLPRACTRMQAPECKIRNICGFCTDIRSFKALQHGINFLCLSVGCNMLYEPYYTSQTVYVNGKRN